jgi:predicted oxidoreductase
MSHSVYAQEFDVIVVGAGAGGLSAAWEAGRRGKQVAVVEMFSVFGGHAVMSEGLLAIVDTPFQRAKGIIDSPAIAAKDFLEWGIDAEEQWVHFYVERSREQLYDWLTDLGVRFDDLLQTAGNSVPRAHQNPARGFGLVAPVFRNCLNYPNIKFYWNTEVTRLLSADGRVFGVLGIDSRTRRERRLEAKCVVLATGGFQSNQALLKSVWPAGRPFPRRLLMGSGVNAKGSGLTLGREVKAATRNLDHQWNYPWGVPDIRFPGEDRGLNARNPRSIWVNDQGRRFVNETLNARDALKALLNQHAVTYWMIFDELGRRSFRVSGTGWTDFSRVEKFILNASEVTHSAMSLEGLARQIGVPAASLRDTVERYNGFVEAGDDVEFSRFGQHASARTLQSPGMLAPPAPIQVPPFYAVQGYPISRKSMGGLAIDRECRVLNIEGKPIPGLFAVGEVAGFGGINGSAGLEGTFLGPAMFQGRLVGREVAAEHPPISPKTDIARKHNPGQAVCSSCHSLPKLLRSPRPGFYHFERAHAVVVERSLSCLTCHAEMTPFRTGHHKIDRSAQIDTCAVCHLSAAASR